MSQPQLQGRPERSLAVWKWVHSCQDVSGKRRYLGFSEPAAGLAVQRVTKARTQFVLRLSGTEKGLFLPEGVAGRIAVGGALSIWQVS